MALGVIGAGKWGEALFKAFLTKNSDIVITSRTERKIQNFVTLKEVLKREYLVIAVASQSLKQFLKNIDLSGKKVLVASKGIDKDNFKFINEIYEEYLPKENIAYIGGPSFAKEVKEFKPTALVLASYNLSLTKQFSEFFPDFIKIYMSNDVMGVEIAGAYKNVIAIASGICAGLNLGENAKASLLARGLVEMDRFGENFGAKKETFLGLAGAGDLFLTANSTLSRNYRVGLGLAKNKNLDTILKEIGEVAEGVWTTEAIYKLSKKFGIYTPIADEVYYILRGKNIKDSLRDLLK
jgi:glycerol-3-phosphate dehydrogenase (NAD(P)+)